jgi:hypothetical protein
MRRSLHELAARWNGEAIMSPISTQERDSPHDDSPEGFVHQSTLDNVMSETEASLRRSRLRKSNTGNLSVLSGASVLEASGFELPALSDSILAIQENRAVMVEEILDANAGHPVRKWLAKDEYKIVIISIIMVNMATLAAEIDFPEWPFWYLVNSLFVLIYIGELILRSAHKGLMAHLCPRTAERFCVWYDLFVIVIGIVDLIFSRSCSGSRSFDLDELIRAGSAAVSEAQVEQASSPLQCTSGLVRCLQLSRLLRVTRVVHLTPELHAFVGMLTSMFIGAMGWIFSVIFIFCFVFAIILTRILGHGLVVNPDSPDASTVEEMFADIPTSMFTLFQLTTADDWMHIAQPVISMDQRPVVRFFWRLFFIFFITFMSWTMLSLLTAVASETMISNTSYKKRDMVQLHEIQRQKFLSFLCEEFVSADVDRNGVLDKQEFTELMHTPSVRLNMKEHGIVLEDNDIERTWKTFDVDDSGVLDINELVDGFALLQEGLATKHVATIGYSLKRFSLQAEQDMTCLEEGAEKLQEQAQELRQRIQAQQNLYREEWTRFLRQHREEGREKLAREKLLSRE